MPYAIPILFRHCLHFLIELAIVIGDYVYIDGGELSQLVNNGKEWDDGAGKYKILLELVQGWNLTSRTV